jgi:hypothetical protein
MATRATGLHATALTGLHLHQLDFIKRFRQLIVVPPLPRLSQRERPSTLTGPSGWRKAVIQNRQKRTLNARCAAVIEAAITTVSETQRARLSRV